MSFSQIVTWIVIGLLAGSLTGSVVTRSKAGFGWFRNAALGLAGALVGGLVVRGLDLMPALDAYSISLRDIVSAVAGSVIVLLAWWLYQRKKSAPAQ
jgi:uncharacterized membrane protein YeaQ/YmgE (transglycosylase-associated protein family)